METVKSSVIARISRKERRIGETLLGSETTLFKTVMVDTHYYTFFKTHRIYISKMPPNVNHGLWVIMTCKCKFMEYNACSTLLWEIDSEVLCMFAGRSI